MSTEEQLKVGDRVQPLTERETFIGTVVAIEDNGWVVVEFPEDAAPGMDATERILFDVLYGPEMKMSPRTTYSRPSVQLRRVPP